MTLPVPVKWSFWFVALATDMEHGIEASYVRLETII
jgi:hypothetical protein